uniref:Uncharacterized protein n=1 Tax=Anguilla anguilla TaxID=7936 RepID=A0A0E9QYT7_ANGAN
MKSYSRSVIHFFFIFCYYFHISEIMYVYIYLHQSTDLYCIDYRNCIAL